MDLTKVDAAGNITAPAYFHSSDQRLKTNIQTVEAGLETILKLRGVTFNWKKGNGKPSAGIIAQDVEKVMPSAVATNSDGYKNGLEYDQLFAPVIEAIKELKRLYDQLAAKVETVLAKLDSHDGRLDIHDLRINALEDENKAMRAALCKLNHAAAFCRP